MAQANVKLTVDARSAVSSLNNTTLATNKLSAAAKGTTASLAGTSAAAKGLAASLAATMGPIIALGAAFSTVNSGLRVFSERERDVAILRQGLKNLDEGVDVLNRLQKAASDFGDATLFSQDEFTRGFALLTTFRKIGVDSYEKVAKGAAEIAQINQVDLKTSFMQLAKALEDPERNLSTLNRSGISFQKTQIDTIKTLMKSNKTAEAHAMILEVVNGAYKELATAGGAGFAGDVDALKESFDDFAEVLGKALVPVIQPAVKGLTALLKFFSSEGGQVTAVIAGAALAFKGLAVAIPLVTSSFTSLSVAAQIATGSLVGTNATLQATKAGFINAAAAANTFKVALAKTGIGLAIISFGMLATKILEAVNAQKTMNEQLSQGDTTKAREQLARLEKQLEDIQAKRDRIKERSAKGTGLMEFLGLGERLSGMEVVALAGALPNAIDQLKRKIAEAEGVGLAREFEKAEKALERKNEELEKIIERSKIETEEGRKQFDLDQRKNELVEKYGEELAKILLEREKDNRELQKGIDKIKEQDEAAKKLAETFEKIGDSIATGVSDALVDAVMQTKSLADSARALLNDIARQLMRLGINTLLFNTFGGAEGIFKNLETFSTGGRPPVGRPSIVGEKGPELFVPSTAGNIIPNNELGGSNMTNNIVVNVDMDGGIDAQGGEQEGRELGRLIAVAVQSEIIQQKRAGGLLA